MAFVSKRSLENLKPRELKFKTREELQSAIDDYFNTMDGEKRPYSIAGLAYFLNVNRQTIYNYEYRQEFSDIIIRARERCIMYMEEKLMLKGTAGQIFLAKNYGYTDRQDIVNHDAKSTEDELQEFEKSLYEDNAKS